MINTLGRLKYFAKNAINTIQNLLLETNPPSYLVQLVKLELPLPSTFAKHANCSYFVLLAS